MGDVPMRGRLRRLLFSYCLTLLDTAFLVRAWGRDRMGSNQAAGGHECSKHSGAAVDIAMRRCAILRREPRRY